MAQLYETSYPLELAQLLQKAANSGSLTLTKNPDRHWVSQPRQQTDPTWEVLTMTFSTPVSISEITVDLIRINSSYEFWYTNRAGNRIAVNDRSLRQFAGQVSTGDPGTWVTINRLIFPVVAVSLELRIQRRFDAFDGLIGLQNLQVRNWLTKRNVYDRNDALQPFEKDVDALGNIVERDVRSWEPNRAIDGDSSTFWKSGPQPTSNAVANFYLDVRDATGEGQQIDRFFLDPVYTGQAMNVYYSTDDTYRTRRLSPELASPVLSVDVTWDKGVGLNLESPTAQYNIDISSYAHRGDISWWQAFTWIVDFDQATSPASDLVLVQNDAGTYYVKYIVGTGAFRVLYNATTYTVAAPAGFLTGDELGFVLRVVRDADPSGLLKGIYLEALRNGTSINTRIPSGGGDTLADLVLNGELQFGYNSGWLENYLLKQDSPRNADVNLWKQNSSYYLTPDPILESNNADNTLPSSTLDNVLVGNDLTVFRSLRGGLDKYFFTDKVWTPVWANWLVYKGFYYFPVPIYAKYLKFELTNLTQEPYSIWESGIAVQYQTFPLNLDTTNTTVTDVSTTTTTTTIVSAITSGKASATASVGSTNGTTVIGDKIVPANITSSTASSSSSSTYSYSSQNVTVGQGTVTQDVPYLYDDPYQSFTTESVNANYSTQSGYSNRTTEITDYTVQKLSSSGSFHSADNNTETSIMRLALANNTTKNKILIANDLLVPTRGTVVAQTSKPPKTSGNGNFLLPNQTVYIPTQIMQNISSTSTTTNSQYSSSVRVRFTNTEVHRYETRTAQRDAALAYFAGFREINIYRVKYDTADDTEVYTVLRYDNDHFVRSNITTDVDTGMSHLTATTAGTITSVVFPSASNFQKLTITPIEKGLRSNKGPVSLLQPYGTVGAAWADKFSTWGDPDAPWDADIPAARADFNSNYSFQGQTVVELTRANSFGLAGVVSPPYHLYVNERFRLGVTLFRNQMTTNIFKLQLVDGSTGTVLYENDPIIESGKWITFTTPFLLNTTDYPQAVVRLLTLGGDAETIFLSQLFIESTSVLYEVSNNGGSTYQEATEAIYTADNSGYVQFVGSNNQLRLRVSVGLAGEKLFGVLMVPSYL